MAIMTRRRASEKPHRINPNAAKAADMGLRKWAMGSKPMLPIRIKTTLRPWCLPRKLKPAKPQAVSPMAVNTTPAKRAAS